LTKSAEEVAAADAGARAAGKDGGFVREWVVPIVLGLAIGGAAMFAWTHGGRDLVRPAFHSKAWNLVEKWRTERPAEEDDIVKQIQALGAGSRDELVAVFRGLSPDQLDAKVWVGRLLTGDPWFATTSLKEIVADPKAAKVDRRAAACALVDMQHKEIDTELVLPVFEEWMKDASDPDRSMAVSRVEVLWRQGMLNSQWEARVKRALLDMAKRPPAGKTDDEDRSIEERSAALLVLELGVADPEVKKALWTAAKDEGDAFEPRGSAIRALAQGEVLDLEALPNWTEVSKSKDEDVRQAVADNMWRAKLSEYDAILEAAQFDSKDLTRAGAIETQMKRRRPTMLARFDELMEDGYDWVRFNAMLACGSFKKETAGLPQRAAMMLRLLETSDDKADVQGAAIALQMLTGETYGFKPTDIHPREQDVEPAALATFMADKAGRKDAAEKWRAHFGKDCVWTDADRAKTLEKCLHAADPKTVERAKAELAALKR